MDIRIFTLGAFQTNCYIVIAADGKQCLVFDPGNNGPELVKYLEDEALTPQAVVLTHGHADHIGGVEAIMEHFQVPLYIHKDDEIMLQSPDLNLSKKMGQHLTVPGAAKNVEEGDVLTCAELSFRVIATPGHTQGGVCYYGEGILIAGDTLFYGSIGRTDFPGGSYDALIKNIREKLYILPDDTVVYPGHGPETTIGFEKMHNPFTR